MKRTTTLNLLLFFVFWGTFKSAESLLHTAGMQEIYAFYGVEWIYFIVAIFGALGGLALVHAIWNVKPWGYILGFSWLAAVIANSIFTGLVGYFNKPLMMQILTAIGESRGRDMVSLEAFINSPAYAISIIGTSIVMITISLFFMWYLYKHRAYFNTSNYKENNIL